MKKMIPAFIASLFISGPAFALKDLSLCKGQFLVSAYKEKQLQVSTLVLEGIAEQSIHLKYFNPQVGPLAIFSLEAATPDKAASLLTVMQELALVPDVIVECDSAL